ncbi:hypothetical protein TVAG_250700 [Trichomonas vaginalis G3]|uniref:Right handed beta helix domain-containing protein n=1 Tax=Trichomonas vaginalis (strain ATCC PRA-98 / G3) TaxID=412133 RepID=A2ESR9_TRIV3|nr:hypothetical protein TVAGG3_0826460 [Trichomonas vaginalis G3]EAY04310.1 hypothetical protein TVAG_250700 [Trichomonas vaginalis G3]KAI5498273.1 hypothetical protein TVAGG3_0826460 [Trichomonas vaginalis G3]|eukprot:XP_001316533.1 hypothetical protein [Trichomonas vaginalis G3]
MYIKFLQFNYIKYHKHYPDDIWNSFFSTKDEYIPHSDRSLPTRESDNYFVHDTLFSNFDTEIIYSLSASKNVLVYKTVFDSNKVKDDDITTDSLIYKFGGNLIQYRVCSYNTIAQPTSTFSSCYTHSYSLSTSLNYILETTIANSIGAGPTIGQSGDNFRMENINISNIYSTDYDSGYDIQSSKNSNNVSFSTFYNISSKLRIHSHNSFVGKIHHLIVKSNKCISEYFVSGAIFGSISNSDLTITACIISNNNVDCISSTDSNSKITISDCYIESNTLSNTGTVSMATTNSLKLDLSHLDSSFCSNFVTNFIYIRSFQITNNPLVNGFDKEVNFSLTIYNKDINSNSEIIIWYDDNTNKKLGHHISLTGSPQKVEESYPIPTTFAFGNHKITIQVISTDGNESNIRSTDFTYKDYAVISVSDSYYSRYSVTFIGNISLKENVNAERLNLSFDESDTTSKLISSKERVNNYQYFENVFQFPPDFEYGSHIVVIYSINRKGRIFGKKSIEFDYLPDKKPIKCKCSFMKNNSYRKYSSYLIRFSILCL